MKPMNAPLRFFFSTAAAVLGCSMICCQTTSKQLSPPATVPSVDLSRYAGEWYEVARLPVFYQGDNERAIATYTLRSDGQMDVINTAIRQDGTKHSVTGLATPVPNSGNAKLRIKINKWPATWIPVPTQGNYWILELAPDYSYALVGTPDRKFLWLLSRTPTLSTSKFTALIERADALGYHTDKLIISSLAAVPGQPATN